MNRTSPTSGSPCGSPDRPARPADRRPGRPARPRRSAVTRPAPGSGRSARRRPRSIVPSGSTRWSVRTHRSGIGAGSFEAGHLAGQPGGSERAALGHRHHVDRQAGAVGQRLDPGRVAHAPAGGHDPGRVDPGQIELVAHREGRRLVRGPHDRAGIHPDVEVVQRGAAPRVVERHPLAPQVGLPHRHPTGILGRAARPSRGRRPRARPTQFTNRPPAFEGPPISAVSGTELGTVQSPSTSGHPGVTAHTISVEPEDHEHVALARGPGDQLLAEGVDRAAPEQRPTGGLDPTDRVGSRDDHRQPADVVDPGAGRDRGVPPVQVEQRHGRVGDHGVDGADAAQGRVGHRLGRPEPGRVGVRPGQPLEEPHHLVGGAVGLAARPGPPLVAVEQAGRDRTTRRRPPRTATAPWRPRRSPGCRARRRRRSPTGPAPRAPRRARPHRPDGPARRLATTAARGRRELLATTRPSPSTASALTDVVPMSMPTVTSSAICSPAAPPVRTILQEGRTF